MATIQLGTTKVANKLITYAEKKAVEREGVNCDSQYAKSQFQATRELWGKADGVQAHHIIQSFKPGEVTPGLANQIGKDLAKEIGKGHEALVYTHADKNHIHNHIVINSVSYEDGKKLHLHGNKAIDKVRQMSDQLCKERDLSIVKEPSAKVRYTMAEKSLIEKGKVSWKDELRQAIDYEKTHSKNYEDFKKNLTEKYGIEVNDTRKHITYKHPDHQRVVRGNKLGLDYERGTIEHGFSRQIERATNRGNSKSINDILFRGYGEKNPTDSSRTGDTNRTSQKEHGRTDHRPTDTNQEVTRERESKVRANSQVERDIQREQSGISRTESNKSSRDAKDLQSNGGRNTEERGKTQGNGTADKGHGVLSPTDSQSIMEGKSEAIRSTAPSDNRTIGGDSGNVPAGDPFDEILKSLSGAIQRANDIEKAKLEQQQQKALQKQQQKEKAPSKPIEKSRGWER